MFRIVNQTRFPFQVEVNDGIEGPNLIPPHQTVQYGAPVSAPQKCIRISCTYADALFEVIHENGNIQLVRGPVDVLPLPSIAWGGEFVLTENVV